VVKVFHSSLQKTEEGAFNPVEQMSGGHSPTFSIIMSDPLLAASLQFRTKLLAPATSLGGVESLLEQRYLSNPGEDPRVVRISVGLEDPKDLIADLRQALVPIMLMTQ